MSRHVLPSLSAAGVTSYYVIPHNGIVADIDNCTCRYGISADPIEKQTSEGSRRWVIATTVCWRPHKISEHGRHVFVPQLFMGSEIEACFSRRTFSQYLYLATKKVQSPYSLLLSAFIFVDLQGAIRRCRRRRIRVQINNCNSVLCRRRLSPSRLTANSSSAGVIRVILYHSHLAHPPSRSSTHGSEVCRIHT